MSADLLGRCHDPAGAGGGPTASFDAVTRSGTTYTVSGWAFDPNAPQQSIDVDVYDRRPNGVPGRGALAHRRVPSGRSADLSGHWPERGVSCSMQLAGVRQRVVHVT